MNGVHDMGGMHGLGGIRPEENEPVFHEAWEGRVYALNRAMGAWKRWNLDAWRQDIEQLPAADYLRMSYYERWLAALEQRLVKYGFVSAEEMAAGAPAPGSGRARPVLSAEMAREVNRGIPSAEDPAVAASFREGDRVRAKNRHPASHTRLPRYVRGKAGVIASGRGVYTFPDTNALYRGENRQHLYSVRFAARELWGEQASPRDTVVLDLWDDYLERV